MLDSTGDCSAQMLPASSRPACEPGVEDADGSALSDQCRLTYVIVDVGVPPSATVAAHLAGFNLTALLGQLQLELVSVAEPCLDRFDITVRLPPRTSSAQALRPQARRAMIRPFPSCTLTLSCWWWAGAGALFARLLQLDRAHPTLCLAARQQRICGGS